MHWPVMPLAASEHRKTSQGATSSGMPMPICLRMRSGSGSPRSAPSTISTMPGMLAIIRVIALGTMALTVTSARASSIAQVRAKAAMPALAPA